MNTYACALIAAGAIALSGFVHAADDGAKTVSCTSESNDARLSTAHADAIAVVLAGRADVCDAGFEYLPELTRPLVGTVLAAPSDLGLRAKRAAYRVSFVDGTARLIGELSVSAERATDGTFVDVFQEGGSAFLEKYEVTPNRVKLAATTFELVLDGRVCVQHRSDVWSLTTGDKKRCGKTVTANFAKPVCLIHEAGKARLAPRVACKELEKRRAR